MAQAKTMVTMTSMLEGSSDDLLATRDRNSHPKATSAKIFNINYVEEMGVITIDEISKVAKLLGIK